MSLLIYLYIFLNYRSEIKEWVDNSPSPIAMVYGQDSPEKQLSEMIALSQECNSKLVSTAIPGIKLIYLKFYENEI